MSCSHHLPVVLAAHCLVGFPAQRQLLDVSQMVEGAPANLSSGRASCVFDDSGAIPPREGHRSRWWKFGIFVVERCAQHLLTQLSVPDDRMYSFLILFYCSASERFFGLSDTYFLDARRRMADGQFHMV